jgi:hypothetical protein
VIESFIERLKPSAQHQFDIQALNLPECFVIRLTDERKVNHRQMGGATFRAVATNNQYVSACPFIDYSNGTYDVVCPPQTSLCTVIDVKVTFLDFGAYRWKKAYICRTLWKRQVCQGYVSNTSNNNNTSIDNNIMFNKSKFARWQLAADSSSRVLATATARRHSWFTGERAIVRLSQSQILQCLRTTNRTLYLMGDSQIRRVMEYWQQVDYYTNASGYLGSSVTHNHVTMPTDGSRGRFNQLNWRFVKAEYLFDAWNITQFKQDQRARANNYKESNYKSFVDIADRWLTSFPNKSLAQISVVISVGTWDLTHRNRRYFVYYGIPVLRQLLSRMSTELPRAKIYLWTIPSCSEMKSNYPFAFNNAAVAAVVNLMIEATRGLANVFVADFFSMTLGLSVPLIDKNEVDLHYLRYRPGYAGNLTLQGELGIDTSAILLTELCDGSY